MPNIKSAKKRVKVTRKKTTANRIQKLALRKQIRRTHEALESGVENSIELLRDAQKKIDQAAARGRMHRNTAARRKSRLARALNRQQG